MRLVLDWDAWDRAGLAVDPVAKAWAASSTRYAVKAELVSERVIDLYELPCGADPTRPVIFVLFGGCPHRRDDEAVTVRRRYRGPVPPQVLAAFEERGSGAA